MESVSNSLTKYLNCFKYIRKHIPAHCAKILYYSFIYSKISYGIEIYGKTSNTNMHKLQVIQNKSLKILLNLHPRTPTDLTHSHAQVLKVHHIYEYVTINFVHIQVNGKLPSIYNNYFKQNNHIHQHFTRNNTNLHLPQINTRHGHNMTKFMGPYLWNKLPNNVKDIPSNLRFRQQLKKHYLQTYNK